MVETPLHFDSHESNSEISNLPRCDIPREKSSDGLLLASRIRRE